MTMPHALPRTMPAAMADGRSRKITSRHVHVTDPDHPQPVSVRWTPERGPLWRCSACGPQDHAACLHTYSAGVLLAEQLIGLTRTAEIAPVSA
ncbi:hypothetical protein [Nocardioides bruguierae]|uniref:Uncharacterized protein n=1 Tax=Nocardioides bruguierae TaxID=2945102 RepID=A0A9X2DEC0_9ACTN|nr:hypothetical protein [Nocardioides bruguierae]MCM0622844.1 hypothetical protein [Nocardioides bruguierae]